ncbi:MAG: hypothetical protein OXH92_13285 [Bryobacterales bacterium]|nr:hypothetical protein [Bryobacterales bacterium]
MTTRHRMPVTRRRMFVESAKGLAAGGSLIALACGGSETKTDRDEDRLSMTDTPACNFQSSYMTWDLPPRPDPRPHARHNTPLGNKARIQLDALLDVVDEASGETERFVLIAACRTEWVYAESGLFQIPSREYRNIYSLTEERSMGRGITYGGEAARGRPVTDSFRSLEIDVARFADSRALDAPAAINEATESNIPLVGRTEIRGPGRTYLLEYPILTMNFRPENSSFQVDTGPLLAPDLESSEAKTIDRLEMAHIAYNRLDRVELILRRPTPITDDAGGELARVLHYSEVREHSATTRILTAES